MTITQATRVVAFHEWAKALQRPLSESGEPTAMVLGASQKLTAGFGGL
jgi:hypothetical protein